MIQYYSFASRNAFDIILEILLNLKGVRNLSKLAMGISFFAVAVTLLANPLSSACGAEKHSPQVIYREDVKDVSPLWVDAESAVDSTGKLRKSLFPETWQLMKEQFAHEVRNASRTGQIKVQDLPDDTPCKVLIGSEIGSGRAESIEELLEKSSRVYVGKVVSIRPGFLMGMPASLVTAKPVSVIREPKSATPGSSSDGGMITLVYEYARFVVGEMVACAGTQRIDVGDVFVTFVMHSPIDEQQSLLVPGDQVFIKSPTAEVIAPSRWRASIREHFGSEATFDDIVAELIELAQRSEVSK